jgi:hypothetical protein
LAKVASLLDDPVLIKQIDKKVVEEYFFDQARRLDILK